MSLVHADPSVSISGSRYPEPGPKLTFPRRPILRAEPSEVCVPTRILPLRILNPDIAHFRDQKNVPVLQDSGGMGSGLGKPNCSYAARGRICCRMQVQDLSASHKEAHRRDHSVFFPLSKHWALDRGAWRRPVAVSPPSTTPAVWRCQGAPGNVPELALSIGQGVQRRSKDALKHRFSTNSSPNMDPTSPTPYRAQGARNRVISAWQH